MPRGCLRGVRLRVQPASTRSRCAPLAAVLVAAALAGGPAPALATAAPPRCATSRLRLVLARQSAAAGRRFWEIALRNVGRSPCALRGYPVVGLLDSRGRPLTVAVEREGRLPIRTVTVALARVAYFTLAYEDSGPCLPRFFWAYGVSVYPPGATRPLLRRTARFGVCSVAIGGSPSVTPVRATLEP